jgi:four helix bundle protein
MARVAYRLTLDPPLSRHYGLADQIRRAAASIPANIAEGYALGTTPQFIRFLRIALGSGTELCTHLELVRDLELAPAKSVDEALVLGNQVVGLLIGLIYSLRRRLGTTRPSSPVPPPPQSLEGR